MHLHSKKKMSICSCVINTLWWAFGGKRKTKKLITVWSFASNWQVMMTFMFTLYHIIIILLNLVIWGVLTQQIWEEIFSGVSKLMFHLGFFWFFFCPGAIPYAPSRFPPEWLPVRPLCFVSSRLSHLINIFSTVLSGNYEVTTAPPNGTLVCFFFFWSLTEPEGPVENNGAYETGFYNRKWC